jgi:hypothetical protein
MSDSASSSFDDVPGEVTLCILSILPIDDLLRCRRVNKIWKELCDNKTVWEIKCKELSVKTKEESITRFRYLWLLRVLVEYHRPPALAELLSHSIPTHRMSQARYDMWLAKYKVKDELELFAKKYVPQELFKQYHCSNDGWYSGVAWQRLLYQLIEFMGIRLPTYVESVSMTFRSHQEEEEDEEDKSETMMVYRKQRHDMQISLSGCIVHSICKTLRSVYHLDVRLNEDIWGERRDFRDCYQDETTTTTTADKTQLAEVRDARRVNQIKRKREKLEEQGSIRPLTLVPEIRTIVASASLGVSLDLDQLHKKLLLKSYFKTKTDGTLALNCLLIEYHGTTMIIVYVGGTVILTGRMISVEEMNKQWTDFVELLRKEGFIP